MSLDGYKVKSNEPEAKLHKVRAVGGSSAVTKVKGKGIAVTRTGSGAYLLTWSDDPGNLVDIGATLQATTPGDLAGHTVIFGAYTAGTPTLAFVVYNASDAAHDLAALEWINITATFQSTGA